MKIFVSYRRQDSEYQIGRICDHLASHFGMENIFFDVESIPVGVDWRIYITQRISTCQVAIVAIGDQWLRLLLERKNDPDDIHRCEIQAILQRGIPTIPLRVGSCPLPRSSELPNSVAELANKNGLPVRGGADFKTDILCLIDAIEALDTTRSPSRASSLPPQSETLLQRSVGWIDFHISGDGNSVQFVQDNAAPELASARHISGDGGSLRYAILPDAALNLDVSGDGNALYVGRAHARVRFSGDGNALYCSNLSLVVIDADSGDGNFVTQG